jgi:hypothetical protein
LRSLGFFCAELRSLGFLCRTAFPGLLVCRTAFPWLAVVAWGGMPPKATSGCNGLQIPPDGPNQAKSGQNSPFGHVLKIPHDSGKDFAFLGFPRKINLRSRCRNLVYPPKYEVPRPRSTRVSAQLVLNSEIWNPLEPAANMGWSFYSGTPLVATSALNLRFLAVSGGFWRSQGPDLAPFSDGSSRSQHSASMKWACSGLLTSLERLWQPFSASLCGGERPQSSRRENPGSIICR